MARASYLPSLDPELGRTRGLVVAIAADIRIGRLRAGERLPGSRSLATSLGLSRGTVVQAYEELRAEGWLESEPSSGMRVRADLPEPTPAVATPGPTLGFALPDEVRRHDPMARDVSVPYRLFGGHPDLRLLPLDELARAYRRVLKGRGRRLLGYSDPQGERRLRVALSEWLAATRGLRPDPDGMLVTRGSQMALYLLAHTLLRPGDVVAVERFGYPPAWAAFESAGAVLHAVDVDDEGMCIDQLPDHVRAVYLTPHHQYPTGATLSAPRRLRLLQWAAERGIALIEDDYDHEYHYDGPPVRPLIASDPAGVVVSIGTLSKAFAPGVRVGFVLAPPAVLDRLVRRRRLVDRQGDRVVEQAMAELIDDGSMQRHFWRTRRVYAARRQALDEALSAHLPGVLPQRRPGGLALWCEVPGVDVDAWASRCVEHGVFFETARTYAIDQRSSPQVRLGFAPHTEDELGEAVRRMARAWRPPM
ncbi:MAG: PLP-dependent aminotransferase family protein [Deltaproteobacteria bacterium]|nr:MAG: PLP-dependent aminotransferase family protein [Deltaproteobacteria bacterium]